MTSRRSRPELRRGSLLANLPNLANLANPANPANLVATTSDAELVTLLGEGAAWRLERIVSSGHASPPDFWYDQDEDEFVLLVAGAARLDLEDGRSLDLAPGDWVELPAHLRHRVAWTAEAEPTVWLALFSRPDRPRGH